MGWIFWLATLPKKSYGGAYIINIFFFATCGTKIRRFFETSYYVIVLRYFGVNFWCRFAPPKIHTGGIYYQYSNFPTCGTKMRRIFYPPKSVIVLRQFGVIFFWGEDINKIITSRYCMLFFVFHIFAIRQALMRDVS